MLFWNIALCVSRTKAQGVRMCVRKIRGSCPFLLPRTLKVVHKKVVKYGGWGLTETWGAWVSWIRLTLKSAERLLSACLKQTLLPFPALFALILPLEENWVARHGWGSWPRITCGDDSVLYECVCVHAFLCMCKSKQLGGGHPSRHDHLYPPLSFLRVTALTTTWHSSTPDTYTTLHSPSISTTTHVGTHTAFTSRRHVAGNLCV